MKAPVRDGMVRNELGYLELPLFRPPTAEGVKAAVAQGLHLVQWLQRTVEALRNAEFDDKERYEAIARIGAAQRGYLQRRERGRYVPRLNAFVEARYPEKPPKKRRK